MIRDDYMKTSLYWPLLNIVINIIEHYYYNYYTNIIINIIEHYYYNYYWTLLLFCKYKVKRGI